MIRRVITSRHRTTSLRFLLPALTAAVHILVHSVPAALSQDELNSISKFKLLPVTGDQNGEYPTRDYVIIDTMHIPAEKSMVFSSGCKLFFYRNACITIDGALFLKGTPDDPITMGRLDLSLPLKEDRPPPFPGSASIYVNRSAKLIVKNTRFADSTISIRVPDTSSILMLDTVMCNDNHVMLPDTTFFLPAKTTVNCSKINDMLSDSCQPPLPAPPVTDDGPGRPRSIRLPLRIVFGAGTVAAAGLGAYYNRRMFKVEEEYSRAKSAGSAGQYAEEHNDSFRYRTLATVFALCGAVGFGVTFFIGGSEQ